MRRGDGGLKSDEIGDWGSELVLLYARSCVALLDVRRGVIGGGCGCDGAGYGKNAKKKKAYTALVLTTLLPKSPARHECAAVLTGYLPKGWGSTIERAAVRIMARNGVADGIFVCIFVDS